MVKQKTVFVCSSCGYESPQWMGKCPECGEWNTLSEFKVQDGKQKKSSFSFTGHATAQKLGDIKTESIKRLSTAFSEFDRVLGGEKESGLVPGGVVLLSGDPGIGKSTLLLQVALNLASRGPAAPKKVLYVTGEESEAQIKLRAERLASKNDLDRSSLFIIATSDIDIAIGLAQKDKFDLVIIDSIQTMESQNVPGYAGSVPQVRHATGRLVSYAKSTNTPVILVGHVTKEGIVAGPMVLAHMVDTVLYLEGEKLTGVRILRAFKNRFGDTQEVGIFTMLESGLSQVKNLAELFMGDAHAPGSCVTVVLEGSRPLLVEVQALVVPTGLSFPRRVSNGIPEKRLELLLAVLQKHAKLPFDRFDVFVNVVGGFKISEPASDLAVCLAIVSSFKNKSVGKLCAIAEVGLLGELKQVVQIEKRAKEAKKFNLKVVDNKNVKTITQVIKLLYG